MIGTLFTVGHSTRTLEAFFAILLAHGIEALADVRRYPGSRRYPHFNADMLGAELRQIGIEYAPFPDLGGRRRAAADSPNTGWRSPQFRGYADFMATAQFEEALGRLLALAQRKRTAMMCSEAMPWRCHRSLIADAAMVRGWRVVDLLEERASREHVLTPFVVVSGMQIVYPAQP